MTRVKIQVDVPRREIWTWSVVTVGAEMLLTEMLLTHG